MGLWDFLTKPRHFGSTVLSWKEPSLYRYRLRGDLWARLAIVLGLWAAATGVLLILFGINVRPPGVMLAIGLGAVFGDEPAPKDAWGNDFVYVSPGPDGRDYDLISYGRDGVQGGTGNNEDISLGTIQ